MSFDPDKVAVAAFVESLAVKTPHSRTAAASYITIPGFRDALLDACRAYETARANRS